MTRTTLPDLTGFQRDILIAIGRDGGRKGLSLKAELEQAGYGTVNHGRLYPNLDTLVDKGLVVKSARDRRTNEYDLTDRGRRELDRYADWVVSGTPRALTDGEGISALFSGDDK